MGNKEFGERVRSLREEKKRADPAFSLRRFAAAIDVSPTFLSRMEHGEFAPPAPDKIVRMAMLLGVDRLEFLALAEKSDPELTEIVAKPSRGMADFLRTAKVEAFSEEEYRAALETVLLKRQSK